MHNCVALRQACRQSALLPSSPTGLCCFDQKERLTCLSVFLCLCLLCLGALGSPLVGAAGPLVTSPAEEQVSKQTKTHSNSNRQQSRARQLPRILGSKCRQDGNVGIFILFSFSALVILSFSITFNFGSLCDTVRHNPNATLWSL